MACDGIEALGCPECPYEEWVSPEDPDTSFSLLLGHVRVLHPKTDQTPDALWPRIRQVAEAAA